MVRELYKTITLYVFSVKSNKHLF